MRAELPSLQLIVLFEGEPGGDAVSHAALVEEGRARLAEDPSLSDRLRDDVTANDVATLVYTSGTTGPPKGAVLTHKNLATIARLTVDVVGLDERDVIVAYLPLAHVLMRVAGYSGLIAGVESVFAESLEKVDEAFAYARPTILARAQRAVSTARARTSGRSTDRGPHPLPQVSLPAAPPAPSSRSRYFARFF